MSAFVNREDELTKFIKIVTEYSDARLIVVEGGKGVGKTELLRQFSDKCQEQQIPWVQLRLSQEESIKAILDRLIDKLVSSLTTNPDQVEALRAELHQLIRKSIKPEEAASLPSDEQSASSNLLEAMRARFNETELHDLCSSLDVEYEDLTGEGRSNKARELIAYMQRRERMPELVEAASKLRPKVPWSDLLENVRFSPHVYEYDFMRAPARIFTDSLKRLQA